MHNALETTNANDDTMPNRRNLLKSAGVGIVTALAALSLPSAPAKAAEDSQDERFPRLIGSWFLQVKFLGGPNAGKTEETLACFNVGGIMVESDGTSPYAHFGTWIKEGKDLYKYTLVEFVYDPGTGNVATVVVPQITFTIDAHDTIRSTSTLTTVYSYNPFTGALVNTLPIPNVSVVTGQRLTSDWVPPSQFPAAI